MLDEEDEGQVDSIFITGPDLHESDGYDHSDTEESLPSGLSGNILKAPVAEITTVGTARQTRASRALMEHQDDMEQDMVEGEVQDSGEPPAKQMRESWEWEDKPQSFRSQQPGFFPEPDYRKFSDKSAAQLVELFLDEDIYLAIAAKSNEYGMLKHGLEPNITPDEIRVFFGVLLLSGFNSVTNYRMYWANSKLTENKVVKNSISRNRFCTVKRCFHLGSKEPAEGERIDRYSKVRLLVKHLQDKFSEHFVPEQDLSHDEAMIKYFGKSSLKQSIRNKPIRFGFKCWVLATVSGYVVQFDLYQGKGVGKNTDVNVGAVGAAGASVLDLLDLLPPDKKMFHYHIFADNFFTSQKLIDVMVNRGYHYTGTIRKDRLKGSPALTSVEEFKKKDRGYHETIATKDRTQIATRWNDNAVVTLASSILGDLPLATAKRFSRKGGQDGKKIEVPQPNIVHQYNNKMYGVDRFDQNLNHLRVSIGGKKWYWSIVTWLLDVTVQNAWQLHKKAGGLHTNLQFREEVAAVLLIKSSMSRSRNSSGEINTGPIGSRPGESDIRYDNLSHFIEKRSLNPRRRCALQGCESKIQTYCSKCDRPICIDHFKTYHTQ